MKIFRTAFSFDLRAALAPMSDDDHGRPLCLWWANSSSPALRNRTYRKIAGIASGELRAKALDLHGLIDRPKDGLAVTVHTAKLSGLAPVEKEAHCYVGHTDSGRKLYRVLGSTEQSGITTIELEVTA